MIDLFDCRAVFGLNFLRTIVRRCDEKKADILGFGVTATSLSNPKHVAHDALARLRDVLYYCPRLLHIANCFFNVTGL